jgi:hypothetical protein
MTAELEIEKGSIVFVPSGAGTTSSTPTAKR